MRMLLSILPMLAGLSGLSVLHADDAKSPLITILTQRDHTTGLKPAKEPLTIKSAEELEKAITDEATRKLIAEKANFKTHTVVVFVWAGSGGDKMQYAIAESFPEQITFTIQRGLTRDLRQHVAIYALRNDCKWSLK